MASYSFFTLLAFASISTAKLVEVSVGSEAPIYTPSNALADVGDVVRFLFNGGNHSVTQAAFEAPCVPLDGGFNSRYRPAGSPSFDVPVRNAEPIFFYCAQTVVGESANDTYCNFYGMVGSINAPPTGNTLGLFQENAKAKRDDPPHRSHTAAIVGGTFGTVAICGVFVAALVRAMRMRARRRAKIAPLPVLPTPASRPESREQKRTDSELTLIRAEVVQLRALVDAEVAPPRYTAEPEVEHVA
ncbi:hypothetical protein EXIGLDRAFT_382722 [Exidia glandulosa HHB12029]|uniref:Extracellular serine-rich protein n=1 Tax=Exidia glandulosa HHB12029 TaxID=1314781 RepID=A0A165BY77_EXIGL|nr:hypothetical protein EXIGLDRAFT_382722 [Exidia glandulosa HHB12029]